MPNEQYQSMFGFQGAELREALLVNPYDVEGTASAIHLALQMPLEERRQRHQTLMRTIREYDVHWWCDTFLDTLAKAEAEETAAACRAKENLREKYWAGHRSRIV